MLINILMFYYIFSVLFMIGYVNTEDDKVWVKIVIHLLLLIIAPIMFPINIGYYIHKNS